MRTEDIVKEWEQDCRIDPLNIVEEATRTPLLTAKYLGYLQVETRVLIAMDREFHKLKGAIRTFLRTAPPDPKDNPHGFCQHIPRGLRVLKSEFQWIEDSDPVITNEAARIDLQRSKVKLLEEIIWAIKDRKFLLQRIQTQQHFESGA